MDSPATENYVYIATEAWGDEFVSVGVTDKDGVCSFEFKSGELSEYNVVDGNYFEGYAVVLDPTTGTSVGARNFLLQQGKTLPLAVYVRQDE